MSATKTEATIEDLHRIKDKAEIVNGEIVIMPPAEYLPSRGSGNVYLSLHRCERKHGGDFAVSGNVGFIVNLPNRRLFSPDAAFHIGKTTDMKFLEGAPVFAVEARSENDYGERAECALYEKIKNYFAAGTLVVWDVDLSSDAVVKKYVADKPDEPQIFRRGETADAEPALPGWRMAVDDIFE
jgi:Uma2 family endonuclease